MYNVLLSLYKNVLIWGGIFGSDNNDYINIYLALPRSATSASYYKMVLYYPLILLALISNCNNDF